MTAAAAPFASSVLALAAECERIIETMRRAAAEGQEVELAGFEEEVARLCAAVTSLPAIERESAADALSSLLAALDGLRAELVRQHDLSGRGAREDGRRAARAYGSSAGGPT